MANKIQIKRGKFINLPKLAIGEMGLCTDENKVFIGNVDNIELLTENSNKIKGIDNTFKEIKEKTPYKEYNQLNKVELEGKHYDYQGFSSFSKKTYGTYNNATVMNIVGNSELAIPKVIGTDSEGCRRYMNRDSVGLYLENTGIGLLVYVKDGMTYTNNSAIFPSTYDMTKVKKGMILDVNRENYPNVYVGIINEVNGNIATLVDGWWCENERYETYKGTPQNGMSLMSYSATKIWGQNTNIFLENETVGGTGIEYGIFNNTQYKDDVGGVDIVNFTNESGYGVRVRHTLDNNFFNYGYISENNNIGFDSIGKAYDGWAFRTRTQDGQKVSGLTYDGSMVGLKPYSQVITSDNVTIKDNVNLIIVNANNVNVILPNTQNCKDRILDIVCYGVNCFLNSQPMQVISTGTESIPKLDISKPSGGTHKAIRVLGEGVTQWVML